MRFINESSRRRSMRTCRDCRTPASVAAAAMSSAVGAAGALASSLGSVAGAGLGARLASAADGACPTFCASSSPTRTEATSPAPLVTRSISASLDVVTMRSAKSWPNCSAWSDATGGTTITTSPTRRNACTIRNARTPLSGVSGARRMRRRTSSVNGFRSSNSRRLRPLRQRPAISICSKPS